MNKFLMVGAAGISLALGANSVEVQAGPFDKLKSAVKKTKKKVKEAEAAVQDVAEAAEVVDAVVDGRVDPVGSVNPIGRNAAIRQGMRQRSNYPKTASRGNYLGRAGTAPAKYRNATKCGNVGLGNAFIAVAGNYTFSQGLNTEERGGLIERENVSATGGCILPALGSGEVLYAEVDSSKYKKYDYDLQCVSYDGKEQLHNGNRPPLDNYGGRHVMLHTGHSLGYTPTASGSNGNRTAAYDKYLKSRGRSMITFNIPDLHTDKSGTDFYCQYYNQKTNQSALAFTFRRGPVGRSGA